MESQRSWLDGADGGIATSWYLWRRRRSLYLVRVTSVAVPENAFVVRMVSVFPCTQ
jgi:hypothetical protein